MVLLVCFSMKTIFEGISNSIEFVKTHEICYNFLAICHVIQSCRIIFICRYCGGRHNSLLPGPNSRISSRNDDDHAFSSPNTVQSLSTQTQSSRPMPMDHRIKLLGTAVLNTEVQGELFPGRSNLPSFRLLIYGR